MTALRSDAPVRRETAATYRGRALIVTMRPGYMEFREKGRRRSVALDYRAGYDLAMKLLAREAMAERNGRKR